MASLRSAAITATTALGVAVLQTWPRKPRDKAKVEVGVQIVERWTLARLRHRTFFGLAELTNEIERLTGDLNAHVMRHLRVSRRELFEKTDRPALRPLPQTRYEYAEWRRARVGIDCHVEVDSRFYSEPYRLLKEEVDVRVTARTIEVFHQHRRVASHAGGKLVRRPAGHGSILSRVGASGKPGAVQWPASSPPFPPVAERWAFTAELSIST